MKRFHSYGPVNLHHHYSVPRRDLVERCKYQLVGLPDDGGHYFTIWAPRQRGKTWLMRQVKQEILAEYGELFDLLSLSFGVLRGMVTPETPKTFPQGLTDLLAERLPTQPIVHNWTDFRELFARQNGLWERPLIMLIDEVDTLPPEVLDMLVGQFRELYLQRETNWLYGLALIGVRAVLGMESRRGSPFNIQQSLPVPNLTWDEVQSMYHDYQIESGQSIDPQVVRHVYDSTQGQPGLVSWFGELLTETYNPGYDKPIDQQTWQLVWLKARVKEPNNTVINLIAKAREPKYQPFLARLFTQPNIAFSFHDPIHSYLYLHGILDTEVAQQPNGELFEWCRYSSPFVQDCLYSALSMELLEDRLPILPLDPLDELTDVFAQAALDLVALLQRYKDYLVRLKAKGLNPWKEQPRRQTDFQLTEAVGHFHLYAWLQTAIGQRCIVSPEFPTGNGKVDLHVKCDGKAGIIEVKSFRSAYELKRDQLTAADYARKLGLNEVTMAVFVPTTDDITLNKLSTTTSHGGVVVQIVAIGWGE